MHIKKYLSNIYLKYLISLFFFIIYSLRFILDTPNIALAGDEPIKWIIANDLANFTFDNFGIEKFSLFHELRWGTWIPSFILLKIFGPNLLIYYISNYLFHLIGILILSLIIIKKFNAAYLIFFYSLIFIDTQIYEFSSQLLPTPYLIFSLSLFFFYLLNYLDAKNINKIKINRYILLLIIFFLYGIKITNLIFLIPLAYFFYKKEGKNPLIVSLLIGIFFYFLETYLINLIGNNSDLKYGRIYALITSHSDNLNWYINYYSKFFLSGIFLRFYQNLDIQLSLIYFFSFLIIIYFVSEKRKKDNTIKILLSICIVYFIMLIFSVKKLSPIIIPIHVFENRYFTSINIFCYVLIIYFLNYIKFRITKKNFLLSTIFVLLFISNPLNLFWEKFTKTKQQNLAEQLNKYDKITNDILLADCIKSHTQPRVKWLPLILARNKQERNFFENFRHNKIEEIDGFKIRKIKNQNCKNTMNIDEYFSE